MGHSSRMRDTVLRLVKQDKPSVCVEVGVWKGVLSFLILDKCSFVSKYYMVDPLLFDCVKFANPNDDEHPIKMHPGVYTCKMGKHLASQGELDKIAKYLSKRSHKYGGRAKFCRDKSVKVASFMADFSIDFVFIDAIHLYAHVKRDILSWFPKVKIGGVISGDDYSKTFPGVISAVREFFPTARIYGHVWYYRKSEDAILC